MLNQSSEKQVHVEVITLALYYAAEMGGWFYVAPAYKSALEDIERMYPRLKFHQNIIMDDNYQRCGEMMDYSDDMVAKYYFQHELKWKRANVTVFVNAGSDCDSHATALLATELRSLVVSTIPAPDIGDRRKWSTRIEASESGKAGLTAIARVIVGIMHRFNWTTILVVADTRNPTVMIVAEVVTKVASAMLRSNVTLLKTDGFSPLTDFGKIMQQANVQTRVILYITSGGTLRKLMLAAHKLNMTRGEHVHLCFRLVRQPTMGNYHWRYGDEDDRAAQAAYQSLFIVEGDPLKIPAAGTDLYNLLEKWRWETLEQFNLTYSLSNAVENFHLTSAYGMLMWAAEVINELVETNRTDLLADGIALARRFYSRTFSTRTGNFTFDGAGSPVGRDCITEQYEGDNLTMVLRSSTITGKTTETSPIKWPPSNWPPPNRPLCGYDGKDPMCAPASTMSSTVVAATLGGIVILLAFKTGGCLVGASIGATLPFYGGHKNVEYLKGAQTSCY